MTTRNGSDRRGITAAVTTLIIVAGVVTAGSSGPGRDLTAGPRQPAVAPVTAHPAPRGITKPAAFGPAPRTIDAACTQALKTDTASQHGCLEGIELLPGTLRVLVRARPLTTRMVFVIGCATSQSCPAYTATPESIETLPPGTPPDVLARYSFLLKRPLASSIHQICARQDSLLPPGLPQERILFGCLSFRERPDPAGEFAARVTPAGVVVDGWILDPAHDQPVQAELQRGSAVTTVTADLTDTRSRTRWPGYGDGHGFRVTLPFVGTGGQHNVCLVVRGGPLPSSATELGCAVYTETGTMFLGTGTVTAGQDLPFTVEMIDPGAQVQLNLYADPGGFFVLPWRIADYGNVTADAGGHAAGVVAGGHLPPGRYRLAFACEQGCSVLDAVPNFAAPLPSGNDRPVALSEPFTVTADTNATAAATWSATPGHLTVEGRDLPPGTTVEALFLPGLALGDGLIVADAVTADVDANGDASFTLAVPGVPSGTHLVWIVTAHDRVLASTTVTV